MPKSIKNLGLTDKIREYIISRLKQAKEEGITSIDLKSGDIHKSLKLENRMPPVCNAMISLGVSLLILTNLSDFDKLRGVTVPKVMEPVPSVGAGSFWK